MNHARSAGLEVIDNCNRLRCIVAGSESIDRLIIVCDKIVDLTKNIRLDRIKINKRSGDDLPIGLLALCSKSFVLSGLLIEAILLLNVLLKTCKVLIDLGSQTYGEGVDHTVLSNSQRIDSQLNSRHDSLKRADALGFIKIFILEYASVLLKTSNSSLLVLAGNSCRINNSLLCILDEIEHEIIVKILSEVYVELLNALLGKRLTAEGHVVTHSEEVGHGKADSLLEDLESLGEISGDNRIITRLDLAPSCRNSLADESLKLLCPFVDNVGLNSGKSKLTGSLHTVNGILLEAVLFDLKKDVFDLGHSLNSRVVSNIVSSFKLKMLILKFVEVSALCGKLACLCRVALGNCLDHFSLQRLEISVKVYPAFLLTSLTLEDHSLGKLSTDLNDRVKGGHRILEDHSDLVAADLVEIVLIDLKQILTVVNDLAVLNDGVTCENTEDRLTCNRLTRTRLTNDSKCLTLLKVKVNTANRLNLTRVGVERYSQIFNVKFICHNYQSAPFVEGLNASRRPLPNRLKEIIRSAKKIAG